MHSSTGPQQKRSVSSISQIVRHLGTEYRSFLKTSFRFLDPQLRQQFEQHLDTGEVVVKGPLVALSREFAQGKTLRDIVKAGAASDQLLKAHWPFEDRPLYRHQERALEVGREGHPFIVTTGTGSGKTEAFLLPVLDGILRAKRDGSQGVKAVFVYPMNALANDQLVRLRRLLNGTALNITFGLYTGNSDASSQNLDEPVADCERATRADIQRNPPDILLTNYKQLEFLLIRKDDRHLFTPALRYLVLDELHTYRGALATEIACLIRRLKTHAELKPGQLIAVGTSATVSSTAEGLAALAEFASNLFGESVAAERIIGEIIEPPPPPANPWLGPTPELSDADLTDLDCTSEAAIVQVAERLAGRQAPAGADVTERLTALMRGNRLVHLLEETLLKPADLKDAVAAVRARVPERSKASDEIIRREIEAHLLLGSIGDDLHPPRLRPKFHLFFHGIYDVWMCLNPACRRLLFHGAGECPACGSAALNAAICRTCGQDFVKARVEGDNDEKIVGTAGFESDDKTIFLTQRLHELPTEEEEEGGEKPKTKSSSRKKGDGLQPIFLCSGCGQPGAQEGNCSSCGGPVATWLAHRGKLNTCPSCGETYTRGDIVTPLRTGTASAVSTLMTHHLDFLPDKERKLLVFADNRQDAAHQAGYTADKHRNFALRHIVASVVEGKGKSGMSASELVHAMLERYKRIGIIKGRNLTTDEKEKWLLALTYELAMEFTEFTRQRASLENLGLVAVEYEFLDKVAENAGFKAACANVGLQPETALCLTRLILDVMRKHRALGFSFFQEYLDPDRRQLYSELQDKYGVFFPPRARSPKAFALDRPDHIRKAASGRLLGFYQENQGAGNLAATQKLVNLLVADRAKSEAFLKSLVRALLEEEILIPVPRYPLPKAGGSAGVQALQIAERVLKFVRPAAGYRCNACRVWRAVNFPHCPNPRCAGQLQEAQVEPDNYYVRLYTERPPQRMEVEEHSAQIDSTLRARRETLFKEGKIDTLVCTPTLELGVDIGPLLTVLLRNAPPTPANYIQRVGRAGRRLRIGFVSTFCAGGAHDRHTFEHPEWMAAGLFTPPRLRLDNIRVVKRHLHSFLLESVEAQLPALMGDFLDDIETPTRWKPEVVESLLEEVKAKKDHLAARLARLFEQDRLQGKLDRYGREECAAIAAAFPKELTDTLDSWWGRVRQLIKEFEAYKAIGADRYAERKAAARKRAYTEITSDRERAYVLNYLSVQGLLPAYQFPVDVFSLDPGVADTPTLYRPSAIAIEEFAPGNLVYANRRKLQSIRVLFAGGPGSRERGAGRTDAESSGRVRRFQFCRSCDETVEGPRNECPRCQVSMAEAVDCMFVEAFEAEESDRIGSDEESRSRKFYLRRESLLSNAEGKTRLYPFAITPAEYRRNADLLITNWGRGAPKTSDALPFIICPDCGRHQPFEYQDRRDDNKRDQARKAKDRQEWSDGHRRYCSGRPTPVVLGYQFSADTLILSVPAPLDHETHGKTVQSPTLLTLSESLLAGACDLLEIEAHELAAFPRRSKKGEIVDEIVFYETVPGGAGYVEEMARRLPEVAQAARERLYEHECAKSCYLCLKHFRNQRWHPFFDKGLVHGLLLSMAKMETPAPIEGKTGQASERLRTTLATAPRPESVIEERLLEALRTLTGLPAPTLQYEFRDERNGNRLVTVADFAYPDAKIAIFCDGFQFHGNAQAAEGDAKKRNWLQGRKWAVLTYWGRTIHSDPQACAEEVRRLYQSRGSRR